MPRSLGKRIYLKLRTCVRADAERKRVVTTINYIDREWIVANIPARCPYCRVAIKTDWVTPGDATQFSIDRLDNSIAHLKSNCRIICLGCNHARR